MCVCDSKIYQVFCVFQLELSILFSGGCQVNLLVMRHFMLLFLVFTGPMLVNARIIFRERMFETANNYFPDSFQNGYKLVLPCCFSVEEQLHR